LIDRLADITPEPIPEGVVNLLELEIIESHKKGGRTVSFVLPTGSMERCPIFTVRLTDDRRDDCSAHFPHIEKWAGENGLAVIRQNNRHDTRVVFTW
jgi:hypothetical protein